MDTLRKEKIIMFIQKVRAMIIENKKTVTITGLVAAFCVLGACYGGKAHQEYNLDSLKTQENIMPIVVIGSGPAGLSAAIYGARANRATLVIEGSEPGGLLTRTTAVENWPGEVSIQGPDIVRKMREHAEHLGVNFLADSVESVDFSTWPFQITTGDGVVLKALTVIIATGANPRKLEIPGEELSGVSSCAVCDAPFFKGQDVAVVGGGDSAAEEAIQLATFVKSVTILVRGPQMRAAASMQERLKSYENVRVMYNVQPIEVLGDGQKVTGVLLSNTKTKEQSSLNVGGVFLAIGHIPNTALFEGKIALEEGGYVKLKGRSQATSVEGVFAAGDVEDHVYRQARVAEGSGVKAALDAETFLQNIGFTTAVGKKLAPRIFKSGLKPSPSTGAVRALESLNDFNALVASNNGLVILDFYADYCPSCLHMLPAYEAVASEYAGMVEFAKVDAEKAIDLVAKFYVTKVPCLLVFSEGKLIGRYNQVMDKKELRDFVDGFMQD